MIMANSILDQSSQEVLRTLDEQLKECTPLECPGEQGHGLDYAMRLEEIKKVSKSGISSYHPHPVPNKAIYIILSNSTFN